MGAYCVIPTIGHSEKGKTLQTAKTREVARGPKEQQANREQSIFRAVKQFRMI